MHWLSEDLVRRDFDRKTDTTVGMAEAEAAHFPDHLRKDRQRQTRSFSLQPDWVRNDVLPFQAAAVQQLAAVAVIGSHSGHNQWQLFPCPGSPSSRGTQSGLALRQSASPVASNRRFGSSTQRSVHPHCNVYGCSASQQEAAIASYLVRSSETSWQRRRPDDQV